MRHLPLVFLAVWAVAFGFCEAAVVIYLRTYLDPQGTQFPFVLMPPVLFEVELGRELATLVLLASVACLAVPGSPARLAAFLAAFGIWDLAYYAALRLVLHWPSSWTDWDMLFLLPVPWMGPVYAPILVSVTMIGVGLAALVPGGGGETFRVGSRHMLAALLGAGFVVASFVRPAAWVAQHGSLPERFPVELLLVGESLGLLSFADAWRRNRVHRRDLFSSPMAPDAEPARRQAAEQGRAAASSSAGAPTSTGADPPAPLPPEAR